MAAVRFKKIESGAGRGRFRCPINQQSRWITSQVSNFYLIRSNRGRAGAGRGAVYTPRQTYSSADARALELIVLVGRNGRCTG